jgi:integrase
LAQTLARYGNARRGSAFSAAPHRKRYEHLQGACYIVCAYLTGMRDSEVQAMQPGCVSAERSADGLIERYRVRSTVYKRQGARGVTADWITIEPVVRAVAVMEILSARNGREKGLSSLWVTLKD